MAVSSMVEMLMAANSSTRPARAWCAPCSPGHTSADRFRYRRFAPLERNTNVQNRKQRDELGSSPSRLLRPTSQYLVRLVPLHRLEQLSAEKSLRELAALDRTLDIRPNARSAQRLRQGPAGTLTLYCSTGCIVHRDQRASC